MSEANWYKNGIIYQVHVKCFYDSNDDGIGDFAGLTQKLDYLSGLGITVIWLLPFYPSPLKDDGYDIADYYNIHPDYGTLKDFKQFLKQAHKRNIKVITELVINHTSNQHPWFQTSRKAPTGSSERNYYVWSDSPEKYRDARIIFKDFETSNWSWDPVAGAYFWHRFYSHQPDLNFDNPIVQKEMINILDYWLDIGVDGFRLDAIPYLFEKEGTNCENLEETHAFLKKIRTHLDLNYENRMLLAEANQWPEDAVKYFGEGDECHMAFHFPVMPRLFMALRMEDRRPIIDILEQTPTPPTDCQWAMFLRNHDELTLEMVTDEERDYMYLTYAKDPKARINLGIRRRLAPLLDNDRAKIELMNILLFSLPGTPVLYYGDEIGMGDNYFLGDRNGVRTPMQWSPDRNSGFSRANPQKLYLPIIIDPLYHHEAVNVENQHSNLSSLLWWMKRTIRMRNRLKAFGNGSLHFFYPSNQKVLVFLREYKDEKILVVINLSHLSQFVELNLQQYSGYIPREVFSHSAFAPIKKGLYPLTLPPFAYFWLKLELEKGLIEPAEQRDIPEFSISGKWNTILQGNNLKRFEEEILPPYLYRCRWFGGKSKLIDLIEIIEMIPFHAFYWLIVRVYYKDGSSHDYLLPVGFCKIEDMKNLLEEYPQAGIAFVNSPKSSGLLIDAIHSNEFRTSILDHIKSRKQMNHIQFNQATAFKSHYEQIKEPVSFVLKGEQTNSSWIYDNLFYFKMYRRLEEGMNPDLEIVSILSQKAHFTNIPDYCGSINLIGRKKTNVSIGLLQEAIPSAQDCWTYLTGQVNHFYEKIISKKETLSQLNSKNLMGPLLMDHIALLGKTTAEMHLALSEITSQSDFVPEPFTKLYQRSLYQSMLSLQKKVFDTMESNHSKFAPHIKKMVHDLLEHSNEIHHRFKILLEKNFSLMRIRNHGDYHLGQVLFTGKEFVIIDFEGEPERSISERRIKKSALQDVAGMIRSFHYAAMTPLIEQNSYPKEEHQLLQQWAHRWYSCARKTFLDAYKNNLSHTNLIPQDPDDFQKLLQLYLLEKAIYECGYECQNRPNWLQLPLTGIQDIIEVNQEM